MACTCEVRVTNCVQTQQHVANHYDVYKDPPPAIKKMSTTFVSIFWKGSAATPIPSFSFDDSLTPRAHDSFAADLYTSLEHCHDKCNTVNQKPDPIVPALRYLHIAAIIAHTLAVRIRCKHTQSLCPTVVGAAAKSL
eukprot:3442053-Amphidinium_carterae.2